jgi:RNA polymerase sigma factor (sigma-70 family)
MDHARRKSIHDAMVRLADGDRTAFDVLVDELWPVLLSFASGLGQIADAEDVAQEVFCKICARISAFDRQRDGASWALGIASYEILTVRRRRQRRREVQDFSALANHVDPIASQEARLLASELQASLQRALGLLSPEDQHILNPSPAGRALPRDPASRKRKQRAVERVRILWRRMYGES